MVDYDTQNTIFRTLVKKRKCICAGFVNKDNVQNGLVVTVFTGNGSIIEEYYLNGKNHGPYRQICPNGDIIIEEFVEDV